MATDTVTKQATRETVAESEETVRAEIFMPKSLHRRLKIYVAAEDGRSIRSEAIAAIEQFLDRKDLEQDIRGGKKTHG